MTNDWRWQDLFIAILGVILFTAPFELGDTSQTTAAWTAYVGGVLLVVFGGGSLLFRWIRSIEYLPLVGGVLLFLAPWVLGYSSVTGLAWMSWVIGGLVFLSAGSALLMGGAMTRSSGPTY